jgi:polysaccharide biosynthesis/export protein
MSVGTAVSGGKIALIIPVVLLWAGCHAPANPRTLPSSVVEQHQEELDATLRESAIAEKEGIKYRVGPGDSLLITVFRHPEFTTIPFTGAVAGLKPGTVVDNDGSIQFPLVGTVNVGGHTLPEIREQIEKAISKYIPEASATVQVLVPGSIRYNMIGQFVQPGVKISDRPLTLLEGIAMAGSIDLARSNLRGAYIARGGRKLPIDFHRLLRGGDLRQNIRLQNNDVILVPDNVNEVVYVFGSGLAKGAAVPLLNGRMNLLQALAAAGFGYTDHSQGKFSRVRVLRSSADHAQFYVVNAEKMLRGEAGPFMLEAGDLVFVPETAWTKWNQILAQVLPSLQLIAGLLEPFVQLKFLGGF